MSKCRLPSSKARPRNCAIYWDGGAPNFAMDRPEGYRKAMRLMRLAERNRLPIVTLVDTSGAYAIAPAKSAM